MAQTGLLLAGIELKLRKLLLAHEQLKADNAAMIAELESLRQENSRLLKEVEQLKAKNNIKVMADTFGTDNEIEEGRKKIQVLMRDIEQCIALINS
jgi:predicted RNase H-like nuclease (RuvC/YqgF family)